jgi:hypothetical protein
MAQEERSGPAAGEDAAHLGRAHAVSAEKFVEGGGGVTVQRMRQDGGEDNQHGNHQQQRLRG